MVIFEKTPRSAQDLALTRGDSLPFSPNKLKIIQSQNLQTIKFKSKTINLDLADKISKIIPYTLIPVIPIVIAYFLIKGRK